MPNTVIKLKRSGTASNTPGALEFGELALNYADGYVYYKASNGTIVRLATGGGDSFGTVNANGTLVVADTPGDILTLVTGNNISIVGDAVNDRVTVGVKDSPTFYGDTTVRGGGKIIAGAVGGDEGGEILLEKPPNGTLDGGVTIDAYQNKLRIFEQGGSARGVYIDLSVASAGVGTDLLASSGTTDTTARTAASAAFDKANSANYYAYLIDANATAAFARANIAVSNVNYVNTAMQSAFSKANTGISNTENVVFAGNNFYFTSNIRFVGSNTRITYSTDSVYITNGAITNRPALQIEAGAGTGGISIGRGTASASFGHDSGSQVYIGSTNWGGLAFTTAGNINHQANNGMFRFTGDANSYAASNGVIQVVAASSVGFYVRFTKDGLTSTSNLRANDVFTVNYSGNVNTLGSIESTGLKVIGAANVSTNLRVGGNVSFDNIDSVRLWEPAANVLTVHTASTERLRVDASGNVSIGTTSTTYRLEVAGSFAAQTKSFVIDHPTKKGMKLRYGSLEGPENGVYVRGRVSDSDVIELPDYWYKLIDKDSITVSLTPIGKTQQPSVGKITGKKVHLIGKDIDCFYHIFAERKDVEKLQVEI